MVSQPFSVIIGLKCISKRGENHNVYDVNISDDSPVAWNIVSKVIILLNFGDNLIRIYKTDL